MSPPSPSRDTCRPNLRYPDRRPESNTAIYILDDQSRPQPVGVEGDLVIGGINVARGYANAGELTSQKFVNDHLAEGHHCPPGRRLYLTGDRALWNANSNVEFRGRRDGQVKLRGLRIELSEIEHVIVASGLARQAAVTVIDAGEDAYLAAYTVAAEPVDAAMAKHILAAKLPST